MNAVTYNGATYNGAIGEVGPPPLVLVHELASTLLSTGTDPFAVDGYQAFPTSVPGSPDLVITGWNSVLIGNSGNDPFDVDPYQCQLIP